MNPTEPAISAKPVFGPATAVLALAVSGRWRAPETTAALAHQAAMQARSESDIATALLAEGWLLHGLLAVGRGGTGVAGAVSALEAAVRSGNAAAEARLRVGLASVARELGDVDSATRLLAPVIERDIIDPELAVDAFLEAIRCGGHPVAGGAHAAVDLAVGHIRTLRGEQVELGLAALDAALAAQHRAAGRIAAAVARAREGLRRLLGESAVGSELDPISPHLAATLSVELTMALLDDGQAELACRVAEPALAWAARPAALVPLTRLRLVLAERAYLPAGQHDAALRAVAWAADVVGDHDLPGLEADCQSLLADVHERRGALPEALAASRRAHIALRTHSARVERALVLLGRCALAAGSRSVAGELGLPGVAGAPGWDQQRHGAGVSGSSRAGGIGGTRSGGAPGPGPVVGPGPGPGGTPGPAPVVGPGAQHRGSVGENHLRVAADNATVRLRSVDLERSSGDESPPGAGAAASWDAASGARASFNAPVDGTGRREPQRARYGGDLHDDRNARPASAMASGSLDDWAAVTGWPGEPSPDSGSADTVGLRAVPTEFQRPEGIGAVSDLRADLPPPGPSDQPGRDPADNQDRHAWGGAAAPTAAFPPVVPRRTGASADAPGTNRAISAFDDRAPYSFVDAGGADAGAAPEASNDSEVNDALADGAALNSAAVNGAAERGAAVNGAAVNGAAVHGGHVGNGATVGHGGAVDDVGALDDAGGDTAVDELGALFEPGERRPLGLVAIDVVTPRGPLKGYVAKPLLAQIADQARAQLPSNARLEVLSSDVVLVVLPPVDADVVLRWMRALATRLSARWSEFAADVPRSTYRVAVGTFDAEQSVHANVEQLRARLAGVHRGQGSDPGLPTGGGRHVARAASTPPESSIPVVTRTAAEPGTGGRRRRREERDDADRGSPPTARTGTARDGVSTDRSSSGHTGGPAPRENPPAPNGQRAEAAVRPYSRGRGIDRVALARLTQMAWRPTISARPADGADDLGDAADDEVSNPYGPDARGMVSNPEHQNPEPQNPEPQNPEPQNPEHRDPQHKGPQQKDPERRDHDHQPGHEGAPAAPAPADAAPSSEAADAASRRHRAAPVTELTFAELLAGALAAYRDT